MDKNIINFIQKNSPDGEFLQSEEWGKFQESVGRKVYNIAKDNFWANAIEHSLPVVGKYFYVPRGPVVSKQLITDNKQQIQELINLAKRNKAGWIRIEPANSDALETIKKSVRTNFKFVRAPHDMQPRELLIIDITKPEEQLLSEMKQKTRYNIRLAEKRGVKIQVLTINQQPATSRYVEEFLRLVKITARRDGIESHPESYYRKMIEIIPGDILKLFVAEYEGKTIAVNLVVFYGKTCTYLHGASDNEHRSAMAPYLLQWRQIQEAKKVASERYDFGGVHTKTGEGITRFKLGFSPDAELTRFPGCYDIVVNPVKYGIYKLFSRLMGIKRYLKIR